MSLVRWNVASLSEVDAVKKISQREAMRLKRRVAELEETHARMRRYWATDYPGTYIGEIILELPNMAVSNITTALRLGHVVLAKPNNDYKKIFFYAAKIE